MQQKKVDLFNDSASLLMISQYSSSVKTPRKTCPLEVIVICTIKSGKLSLINSSLTSKKCKALFFRQKKRIPVKTCLFQTGMKKKNKKRNLKNRDLLAQSPHRVMIRRSNQIPKNNLSKTNHLTFRESIRKNWKKKVPKVTKGRYNRKEREENGVLSLPKTQYLYPNQNLHTNLVTIGNQRPLRVKSEALFSDWQMISVGKLHTQSSWMSSLK